MRAQRQRALSMAIIHCAWKFAVHAKDDGLSANPLDIINFKD